jgi:hypothetical protein
METPLSTAEKVLKTNLDSAGIIRDCKSLFEKASESESETLEYLWSVYEQLELDTSWAKGEVEKGHPFTIGNYKYVRHNKEKL